MWKVKFADSLWTLEEDGILPKLGEFFHFLGNLKFACGQYIATYFFSVREESSVKKPAITCRDVRITNPELFSGDDSVAPPPPQRKRAAEAASLPGSETEPPSTAAAEPKVSLSQPEMPCEVETGCKTSDMSDLAPEPEAQSLQDDNGGADTAVEPSVYIQPGNIECGREVVKQLLLQISDKAVTPATDAGGGAFVPPSIPFQEFCRPASASKEPAEDSRSLAQEMDAQLTEIGDSGGKAAETEPEADIVALSELSCELGHAVSPNTDGVGSPRQGDLVPHVEATTTSTEQLDAQQALDADTWQQPDAKTDLETCSHVHQAQNPEMEKHLVVSEAKVSYVADAVTDAGVPVESPPDTQPGIKLGLNPEAAAFTSPHQPVVPVNGMAGADSRMPPSASEGVSGTPDAGLMGDSCAVPQTCVDSNGAIGDKEMSQAAVDVVGQQVCLQSVAELQEEYSAMSQDMCTAEVQKSGNEGPLECSTYFLQGEVLSNNGNLRSAPEEGVQGERGRVTRDEQSAEAKAALLVVEPHMKTHGAASEEEWVSARWTERVETEAVEPPETFPEAGDHEISGPASGLETREEHRSNKDAVVAAEATVKVPEKTASQEEESGEEQSAGSENTPVEPSVRLDKVTGEIRVETHKELGAQPAENAEVPESETAGLEQQVLLDTCAGSPGTGIASQDAASTKPATQPQESPTIPSVKQHKEVSDHQDGTTAELATLQEPCMPDALPEDFPAGPEATAEQALPPGRPLLGAHSVAPPATPVNAAQEPVKADGVTTRISSIPDSCVWESPHLHGNRQLVQPPSQFSKELWREDTTGSSQEKKGEFWFSANSGRW